MPSRRLVVALIGFVAFVALLILGPRHPVAIPVVLVVSLALFRASRRYTGKGDLPYGQEKLGICPRCGKRMLAPDIDQSGVRHCWACGADVTAAEGTEGI